MSEEIEVNEPIDLYERCVKLLNGKIVLLIILVKNRLQIRVQAQTRIFWRFWLVLG